MMLTFIPIVTNILISIGIVLLAVKFIRKWITQEIERKVDEVLMERQAEESRLAR